MTIVSNLSFHVLMHTIYIRLLHRVETQHIRSVVIPFYHSYGYDSYDSAN